jgi:hypothetical protein
MSTVTPRWPPADEEPAPTTMLSWLLAQASATAGLGEAVGVEEGVAAGVGVAAVGAGLGEGLEAAGVATATA